MVFNYFIKGENMNDNQLVNNLATQTANVIGNLNLQVAKLQTENQSLANQNQELQRQVKILRNGSSTNKEDQKKSK